MQNLKRPLLAFATCLIFGLMGTLQAQTPPPATANAQKQPGKKLVIFFSLNCIHEIGTELVRLNR